MDKRLYLMCLVVLFSTVPLLGCHDNETATDPQCVGAEKVTDPDEIKKLEEKCMNLGQYRPSSGKTW